MGERRPEMAEHDQRAHEPEQIGEYEEASTFSRELSEARAQLAMLKELLRRSADRASSLVTERDELLRASGRVPALETSLADRDGEISRLAAERDELAILAGRVLRLEESLVERESGLSRLATERDELAMVAGRVRNLEESLAERDREVSWLAADREARLASTSWRLTGPARWAATEARMRLREWRRRAVRFRRRFVLRALRGWRRDARLVASSRLFDADWYLERHPDVAASGVSPVDHFAKHGAAELRDPHPLFSTRRYLEENPDVARSGVNALIHFVLHGRAEGRQAYPADSGSPAAATGRYAVFERLLPPIASVGDRPIVLCVTHVRPWPRQAGNEYRVGRLLDWLVGRGHPTLVALAPLGGQMPDEAGMQEMVRRYGNVVVSLPNGRVDARFTRPGLSLSQLEGREFGGGNDGGDDDLADLERQFCHDALVGVLLELERSVAPCVLYVNYVFMTRFLPLTSGRSASFVDTHDVFSTRQDKVGRFGIADPLCLSPEQEAQRLRRADAIVAIQAEEGALLAGLVPDRAVLTAGVDFDADEAEQLPSTPTVVCVASDNALNVKGLRDFLRFAWPLIRREEPEARLLLAGRAAVAVEFSGTDEGIEVRGVVDDVAPLYREARVAINPAVAGTGFKVKTMEALRHFRPIVTFPHGVDGVTDEDLRGLCRVVGDWYEFAWTTVEVLRRGVALPDAAAQARICRALSPDTVYQELGGWLDDTARNGRGEAPKP